MAEKDAQEEVYKSVDNAAAEGTANHTENVAVEPLQYVDVISSSDTSIAGPDTNEKGAWENMTRTRTETTERSTVTVESAVGDSTSGPIKVWYKRMNPLKWGKKPPVPKERTVSREYGASFLSMLTFQWMAPLMTVITS